MSRIKRLVEVTHIISRLCVGHDVEYIFNDHIHRAAMCGRLLNINFEWICSLTNNAIQFVVLHEIGHLVLGHTVYKHTVSGLIHKIINNFRNDALELAADAWAFDRCSSISLEEFMSIFPESTQPLTRKRIQQIDKLIRMKGGV